MVILVNTYFSLDCVDGSQNPFRYLMPRLFGFIWCIILVDSVQGALGNTGYISDQIFNIWKFLGNLTNMEAADRQTNT